MIRLGLCCLFREQPIKFRTTTAAALSRMERSAAVRKLADLCLNNAEALLQALTYCHAQDIGAFRVMSQILPLKTHPQQGYRIEDLPDSQKIVARFQACGELVRSTGLRTSFHPDQFVVLNSPRDSVVAASVAEIEYQAEVAEWIGADVINIHAGGAYGDKAAALARLEASLEMLSPRARSRLTLENDDAIYTPAELAPLCQTTGTPLVYDVHHHRCCPDGLTEIEATELAMTTWRREPLFHISSPLEGWQGPKPERHHDFIDVQDFPRCWLAHQLTVDVEAKAKELAVFQLKRELAALAPMTTR
jgi:UV DNA damage endonuclease